MGENMKEELLRVLNNKLNSINSDLSSLKDINEKIDEITEELSFVDGIINVFIENSGNNPLNFDKIVREDFDRSLDIAGDEVKNLFNSGSCNYDGLVYLIKGIKSGVSIALTNEQMNGIEYYIQTLNNKKGEMDAKISELEQSKNQYAISDINELKIRKDKYENVINEINKNEYIKDIDLLKEAINYSALSSSDTINLLSFILEYNANLFKENKPVIETHEEKVETHEETKEQPEVKNDEIKFDETESEVKEELPEEAIEEEKVSSNYSAEDKKVESVEPNESDISTEKAEESENIDENTDSADNEFHFNQVENDNLFELPNITFGDLESSDNNETESVSEDIVETSDNNTSSFEENIELPKEDTLTEEKNEYEEFKPVEEHVDETVTAVSFEEDNKTENDSDIHFEEATTDSPVVETPFQEIKPVSEDMVMPSVTDIGIGYQVNEEKKEEQIIDNDFKDVINEKVDYETNKPQNEEKVSTRELHKILGKYGIEENEVLNELIDGDVKEYQKILDLLRSHDLLDTFKKNKKLLIETLLYSSEAAIDKVLRIIKEDLSVDDEDYGITLKIVINTIPSVFIIDGGNYNNFVKNIELFKDLEINLINLFDFSKEIFVADHQAIENNLAIVNKYDFDINYKNAKYFLLIPNIAEKLDYYIESVYEDKIKHETFDGIKYIKEYAPKLNVVTDETIKRLRYASVNGKKVFGNKPGSLTGEITNLKVNAIDLTGDYLSKFFNNEFNDITRDEVREYVKLIHNSSNVGDYSDELDKLSSYHNGLRYVIEGINVSYNKVHRIYNVLRSYGIDSKKALRFAVCYNLVITKDEYNKLNDILSKIGGNI